MDPTDILRERVSNYMCGKYNLPAMVLSRGRTVTIVCCCRKFENELRIEIAKSPEPEIRNLKITFMTGNVEFV